jgi:hypothetical protein
MDFRFLYDEKRKLFTIGYHIGSNAVDNSYYVCRVGITWRRSWRSPGRCLGGSLVQTRLSDGDGGNANALSEWGMSEA